MDAHARPAARRRARTRASAAEALRLERARLAIALAAARLGTWEVDLGTRALRWSPEAYAIYRREPAAGPPTREEFYALVHPDDRGRVAAAWERALASGNRSTVEFRSNPAGGDPRHWHTVMQRVDDGAGRPEAVVGVVQDVTEIRAAERALHEHRARLDALVVALERRVEERTAELAAANRQLDSFVTSVSHDLRAPLRAIDGFTRILLAEHASALPPDAAHCLDRIHTSTRQMAEMLEALLAFARLGAQRLEREPVDMDAVVARAWAALAPERAQRRIAFVARPLPPCSGDRALLERVVANLLSNAIKFTRPRPVAHVEVGFDGAYYVRDDGIGFHPEQADHIFGAFRRAHGDAYEGAGVGLAIVERIVDRHGGTVWADGTPDGGATFRFTLPIAPAN